MTSIQSGSETGRHSAPNLGAADPNLPFTVVHSRHGDAEFAVGHDDTVVLTLILSEGQRVERRTRGTWLHRPSRIGLVTALDPDELTRIRIRGHCRVAKLFIPVSNLAEAAEAKGRPNLKARFIEADPVLERCAQRALVALQQGDGANKLLLSSILSVLSTALVEQPSRPTDRAVGGLSRRQLRRVEELIASRLAGPVSTSPSLGELAAEANLSLHHFAREFRRTMGVTPYAHMLRRRLDSARRLVIDSSLPLARIGTVSGFPSPAHFADRFHREMGVAAGALRRAAQA